jgi:NAD(P)-dependent dehydrogenase (short-subunit alcohol dehydrogenase family)/ribonuclease HI
MTEALPFDLPDDGQMSGESRTVYTDGACSGNPGPGGWAWAVAPRGELRASGGESATTNQRMELLAVLSALRELGAQHGPIEVVSDSQYVVKCFTEQWWQGWLRRGWKNKDRQPIANQDLWEPLIDLVRRRGGITFRWVRGHDGDAMNELVDALAVSAIETRALAFAAMDLANASAIVTGGASGIGAASAILLAKRGAKVVIADLQVDKGEALAKEIGGAFCKVDVTSTQDIINATEMAKSIGPVRALVNSAGIGWAQRTVGKDGSYDSAANLDAFKKVIAINLIGTFDCIRIVGTAMSRNEPLAHGERGAIVNIASVAAFDGQIGQASYSASKGGVVGMTLPIARDLAAIGVRVNTVAPGLIDTPIYGQGDASEAFKSNLQKGVLFPQRLGTAEELASMVVECIVNSYMNAETIRVDGGIRMPPK